jgi:hypothetical protein
VSLSSTSLMLLTVFSPKSLTLSLVTLLLYQDSLVGAFRVHASLVGVFSRGILYPHSPVESFPMTSLAHVGLAQTSVHAVSHISIFITALSARGWGQTDR